MEPIFFSDLVRDRSSNIICRMLEVNNGILNSENVRRLYLEKIKKLSIPNDVRIIIISDIHGELDLLRNYYIKLIFKMKII